MKKTLLCAVVILYAALGCWGQSVANTINTSGGTATVTNINGFTAATFEELPSGSPATVSVTVQGCMRGQTCDAAADTNTSTSAALRPVSFSKVYDYFLVTASWTGGTSAAIAVNTHIGYTPASASGSNVTVTSPVDGSGYVNVHCQTGCAGGNPNGQATMANSAPVVIASNQSAVNVAGTGSAGTANAGVVTVQGIASMTKLLVTPDSVALPANQSVNVNQVAGASTGATNPLYTGLTDGTTGPVAVKAASTAAVATDKSAVVQLSPNQPALTTPLNVSLAANQSVNNAQVAGAATSTAASGVQKVGVVGNAGATVDGAPAATAPTNAVQVGVQFNTSPTTLTTGQMGAAQANSKGELLTQVTDGTTNAGVIAGTTALKTDLSSVAGTATGTAAAGVQKVGVVGNTGAAIDAAGQNVTSPANEVLVGCQFNTTPTTVTTGNMSPCQIDSTGHLLVGGSVASGSAVAGNPVPVAGVSGGNAIYLGGFLGSADAGTASAAVIQSMGHHAYNGTTWDRQRTASAANLALGNSTGAELVEYGPRVAVNSQPAVSTQATASVAAGGAGVRHVFDHVCFSGGSTTAPALTQLAINVRDGATGAGTVLVSFQAIVVGSTGQNVAPYCSPVGANILGTANTAMTAEWSALLTNEFEQVTLYYYNVN